jgi:carboxymethylenebutenolidase
MGTSSWHQAESDQSMMRLHVSVAEGSGPFPGIIVMQHQGGVDEFMQGMTQRLAAAGYVAAAPDLYHRDGPECQDDMVNRRSRLRDRNIINDVNASVRFLQHHRAVDGQHLGIIGFCMGGRIVYLMAAASQAFKAAVAYYPGHLFRAWGRELASPFERTAAIQCAVQGHFGADDKNPSPDDMRKLDVEMAKFNKAREFYSYPDAGHAFMDSTKESYRRHADDAAWPRTLRFFREHLQS